MKVWTTGVVSALAVAGCSASDEVGSSAEATDDYAEFVE